MRLQKYVLDTNVLIDYPYVMNELDADTIIVPHAVVNELEILKERRGLVASQARVAIRVLEEFVTEPDDDGSFGLPSGARLVFDGAIPDREVNAYDTEILRVTKDNGATLITNDLGMKVRALCFKIDTQIYPTDTKKDTLEHKIIFVDSKQIDNLSDGRVSPSEIYETESLDLKPNEYVVFRDRAGSSQSLLARYNYKSDTFVPVITTEGPWGVRSKNVEQRFAIDALMNDNIPLVILSGPAGSGKTFLSVATALEKVLNQDLYRRIIIVRPALKGRLGYFPGTKREKMAEWIQGVSDNASALLGCRDEFDALLDQGTVELDDVDLLKGRSLDDTFLIVDEASDLYGKEVKKIVSRMGKNSKVILVGDVTQIDNPGLNENTSGLTHLIRRLHTSEGLGAHVHLKDSTPRSELASWAVKNL